MQIKIKSFDIVILLLIISFILPHAVYAAPGYLKQTQFPIEHSISSEIHYMVPAYLEIGDMLFLDSTSDNPRWNVSGKDHACIYIGNNEFVGTTYNEITEVAEVNIENYTHFMTSESLKNPAFGYVASATDAEKQAAVNWALSRIGDAYQYLSPLKIANPDLPLPTADKWYCSEIVWAAYYNLDECIDIDQNGWSPIPWLVPAVSPNDIVYDDDVVMY